MSAKLKARTALHVGAGRGGDVADALLRRTAAGELFIPGSAVGGALRALATRLSPRLGGPVCKALLNASALEQRNKDTRDDQGRPTACRCLACHLFGAVDPQEQNEADQGGRAARLWVYDARLNGASDAWLYGDGVSHSPHTWVRDGVGIDRRNGAAARSEAAKFDLEVLPAGVTFDLRLEVEDASPQDEQLLAAVLAEWQAGRAALGGRIARGLGAFDLVDLTCQQRDLNTAEALMAFLRDEPNAGLARLDGWVAGRLKEATIQPAIANARLAESWVEMTFTLQASGPFLSSDVTIARQAGFDHAPLVEWRPVKPQKEATGGKTGEEQPPQAQMEMELRPLLPGASLRGVLRSQAERIARTLAAQQARDEAFLERCPACNPLARPLEDRQPKPLESCDALLTGVIPADEEVADEEMCLACRLFGNPRMGSRLIVEDAPLLESTQACYKVQDFLAIDRFTGGGKEGAKFDAAVLWRPAFAVRLRLENPRGWELGWLALTLRDLAEGWLTLGFGRAKGFGQASVTDWTVAIGFLGSDDFPARSDVLEAARRDDSLYHVLKLRGTVDDQPDGKHTWRLKDEANSMAWLEQISDWIGGKAGFMETVRSFRRKDSGGLPKLLQDSYFGQPVRKLYATPEEMPLPEEVHHVQP